MDLSRQSLQLVQGVNTTFDLAIRHRQSNHVEFISTIVYFRGNPAGGKAVHESIAQLDLVSGLAKNGRHIANSELLPWDPAPEFIEYLAGFGTRRVINKDFRHNPPADQYATRLAAGRTAASTLAGVGLF